MRRTAYLSVLLALLVSCGGAPKLSGEIFVGTLAAKAIDVYDAASYKRVATIPLPGGTHAIDAEPGGHRIWTANIEQDSVSVVDVKQRKVITTIRVCDAPTQVAFAPAHGKAFVACGDGFMTVIDLVSLKATGKDAIGFGPHAFLAGPNGHLWSANRGGNDISEIDPENGKLIERHPAAPFAYGLAFSPNGKYAFVTSRKWHSISVVSLDDFQILGAIEVGNDPAVVVASRDGKRLYVSNRGDGTVSVINALTFQVVRTITVDREPDGMALAPGGKLLFVADHASDVVSVIDTGSGTVVRKIPTSDGPNDVELVSA